MRRRQLASYGLLVVLVVVVATAAVSAQPPQQRPTFRSGVDVIEVDVTVIDDDGHPIPDVDASEFTVRVDGDRRRVLQAQFIWLRPPQESLPPPLESQPIFFTSNTEQRRGRLIVIAVDEESIHFGEGRHVMRAAGEFVDQLTPLDRVALMALPTGQHIDFTSDLDRVRREVVGMAGRGERVRRDLNMGLFEAFQISEYRDTDTQERVTTRECGEPLVQDFGCASRVIVEARSIVEEERFHALNTRRGLEAILRALSDYEGPKALVWIAGGLVVGREAAFLAEIEELAAASRTTVYAIRVDAPQIDTTEQSRPPSPQEDDRMREAGLQAVTAVARGELMRAHYNPGPIFERLERELSGYYLLGVEARPEDRNEERRSIDVSVRREGARVRARREVSFESERDTQSVDDHLARMLRSPVVTTDLPVRVATYTYPDAGDESVRVTVAAEVGGEVDIASDLTVAFALRNPEGTVVATGKRSIPAALAVTAAGPVRRYSVPMVVGPGDYTLRIAVVDGAGQRGSVQHPLRAEPRSDRPLAVGDLTLAERPSSPGAFRTPVEARVSSGWLLAYTELYAEGPPVFDQMRVVVEVADDESGPARASADAVLGGPTETSRRFVSASVAVDHLPPGRYVARALVLRASDEVARLHRPFQITGSPYSEEK
ncbi:MAG: VWA domain-containing protein [Acidobacteria bacterium]|nr:VWA domain-containing protein [Acidobacteriota bacterium]